MWNKELETARLAARAAGKILSRMFGHVNHIKKKGNIDLVTEADLEAEKIILKTIRRDFPKDSILSEESGMQKQTSGRTWIVDPFGVSIALEIEKEIVLGIVYNPHMDEYYEAVRGRGALLNNRPIHVSKTSNLNESLLATGFPYNIHEKSQEVIELFGKMIVRAQGIRRPGSAAIDLCYVAAGRLDGFWEQDLYPWDTAAGIIIVEEAGGKLTTFEGKPYSPYQKTIVAANPFIHGEMLKVLSS
ncbi:MAG: inositol monophosphatase [Deltaproteobacteria bacterium]|nr:inositol monophosphatase [Deltaproteobacteria bacterium]